MPVILTKEVSEVKVITQEVSVSLAEVLREYDCNECPLDKYCDKAIELGLGSVCSKINDDESKAHII